LKAPIRQYFKTVPTGLSGSVPRMNEKPITNQRTWLLRTRGTRPAGLDMGFGVPGSSRPFNNDPHQTLIPEVVQKSSCGKFLQKAPKKSAFRHLEE